MVGEALNSFRLTLDYLRRLVADVPDAEFTRQPAGLANHPAWVIGHLGYSCQALGGDLGLAAWLPGDWGRQYGTGSLPSPDRSAYPPKANLLATLTDAEARLSARLADLGNRGMAAPFPDERYRAVFPTVGHAVVHLLGGHAAVHVGQVSAWRRAAGYPPLSEAFP